MRTRKRSAQERSDTTLRHSDIGDTMVHVAPGGSYSVQVSTEFDYGAHVTGPISLRQPAITTATLPVTLPFTLGSGSISSDVKLYTTGRGRAVAQRFYHFAADQPFFLGPIERQIAGAGEDQGARSGS